MADEDDEVKELRKSLFQFGTEEPNGDLILVAAQKCIEQRKWRELVDIFARDENKDALEFVGWELISVLSRPIVDGSDSNLVQQSARLLTIIAETCSAKEVCIGVLEQLESEAYCYNKFVVLVSTLAKAIHRLGQKKNKYVCMVLPCLTQHIRQIHIPDVDSGDEGMTDSLCSVLLHVLQFLDPLVQDVDSMKLSSFGMSSSSHSSSDLQKDMIFCLIQLLDYPLVFLDTSHDPTEKEDTEDEPHNKAEKDDINVEISQHRCYAQDIMQYLHKCNCSFRYLMEFMEKHSHRYAETAVGRNKREEEVEEREIYPALGLGCFAYLLLVENMEASHFPAVFSCKYLLTVNMKNVMCLLKRKEHSVVYKGLKLLYTLSRGVEPKSLEFRHDRFSEALNISKALVNIMVTCSSKKLRSKGVQIFSNFFGKLDTRGRYGLLHTILNDCSHSGVAGLLIYLLKEQVNEALSCTVAKDPWFQGSRVMSILQLVFKLPAGVKAEKDLVQETDRIMAALNCLRFILLRDESDKTTVWRNFTILEQDFLDPLREALKITRIQYQADLISKQDEITGNKEEDDKIDIEFNINSPDGKLLGLMPLTEQCEALQSGLYSLDMMESVLARISEICLIRTKGL